MKAAIAHVVGSANATRRIHAGSRSIGHQHPPTAAIVTMTIEPTGSTASRLRAAPATMRPKAVPANTIPAVGSSSAHGSGPSEMPNAIHPSAKSVTICITPTRKRARSLATSVVANGIGIARRRSSMPQSRSSRRPSETPRSIPSSRKVMLNPGTF